MMGGAGAAGSSIEWEPRTRQGWVAPRIAAEFPGLAISWTEVEGRPGRSPAAIRRRLAELSDRFYGSHAVHMRQRPIPWAYRVFFRQIGLDPDRSRTPVEQLALERMQEGGFKSRGRLEDALRIATVETAVALRAFAAEELDGGLNIRDSAPGESLPGRAGELPAGTLVIADERAPLGVLFGPTGQGYEVGSRTRRILIAAIQVKGVPQIAVDEALWIAASTMATR